jgi:ribonuclease BN (tRNA processing enzyme)
MAQDRIILLGTKGGPRIAKGSPWPTSSVLQMGGQTYLIDAGIGVTRQFVEAGLQLNDISKILITHHHSDHNLELGGLIHTAWTSSPVTGIDVYGPTGLNALLDGFFAANAFDIETRMADEKQADIRKMIHSYEITEGHVFSDDNVEVTALRVSHPPIEEAYAYKFKGANKTVVFSGDTCYFPALADFAKGADVLVHEAMHRAGIDSLCERLKSVKPNLKEHLVASHTYCDDVGRIASAAGVGHLVLNHFVPSDDMDLSRDDFAHGVRETYDGNLSVGYDLFELEY